MLEFIEKAKKFTRQHWKGVIALILALVALGLVIAFPELVLLLGDLVLFGSTPFEFLSLMMLSEIPFFMWLASFFASTLAFFSVLAGSAVFNFATYCYNYCYEKVKKFWENHQTVMILLAALVVVGTIALMVLTQSWVIPVVMVVFHVAAKMMKWLDEKIINPKCDMILLSEQDDPRDPAKYTEEFKRSIKKKMHCSRSYFLFNEPKNKAEAKNEAKNGIKKETKNNDVKQYLFEYISVDKDKFRLEPIEVKQDLVGDEKQKLAEFIGLFPKSKELDHKVVSELEPGIKGLKDWRASSLPPLSTSLEGSRRASMQEEKHVDNQRRPSAVPEVVIPITPESSDSKDTPPSSVRSTESPSPTPSSSPSPLTGPNSSSLYARSASSANEEEAVPKSSPAFGLGADSAV